MFGPRHVKREGLETIYRAAGMLKAQVIKGRLEASGIPVLLDYEPIGQVFALTVDGLGEVRVLVPIEMAEAARELIAVDADDAIASEDDDELE
ncbi:MAG TPA: DUF2007 domain-containing protein [Anaerolineae bacterium]|nr:DUF2007 domain-containing protein [Anaerolineae bacterium]